MSTRREFIRTAALGTAAAAALPSILGAAEPAPASAKHAAAAGPAPSGQKPSGLIDLHSHWFSPTSSELLSKRSSAPKFLVNEKGEKFLQRPGAEPGSAPFALGAQWFDIDARVKHLEEQGVAHQLISWPTTLGVDAAISASEARQLWTVYNNELSGVIQKHPARFSGVATLATADIEWSAKELARAHDQLGLIGGVLPINVFATLEGAKHFAPVFEVAQKYRSHIYLHTGYGVPSIPGQPPLNRHSDSAGPRNGLDNIWNFAAATITFAHSGFLEKYPDVTIQIAQLGGSGGIALVEELARSASRTGASKAGDYRQLYLDTGAGGRGPQAIALAARVFGAERIVFGTDYAPGPSVAPLIAAVNESPLTDAQRRAIFTDNARQLLASKGVK